MGSQGATKTLCYIFVSVVENHSTVFLKLLFIILSKQAQIILLIILLVAIVNVFVGMFIAPSQEKKAKGIFNYDCKTSSPYQ